MSINIGHTAASMQLCQQALTENECNQTHVCTDDISCGSLMRDSPKASWFETECSESEHAAVTRAWCLLQLIPELPFVMRR